MTFPDPRSLRPPEPHVAIDHAIELVPRNASGAIAWALIAIATELGAIRRELRKGR